MQYVESAQAGKRSVLDLALLDTFVETNQRDLSSRAALKITGTCGAPAVPEDPPGTACVCLWCSAEHQIKQREREGS